MLFSILITPAIPLGRQECQLSAGPYNLFRLISFLAIKAQLGGEKTPHEHLSVFCGFIIITLKGWMLSTS
jgi:hypothetical protein